MKLLYQTFYKFDIKLTVAIDKKKTLSPSHFHLKVKITPCVLTAYESKCLY